MRTGRQTQDKKDNTLKLRLNDNMRAWVERRALARAVSMSEFMRELIMADMQSGRADCDLVQESLNTLRNELVKKTVLYSGFLSSIESSLRENLDRTDIHDLAADVLDRIIGFDTEVTE